MPASEGQRFRCLVTSCGEEKTFSLTTLYEHLSYHAKDMGFDQIFEYKCATCKGAFFTSRMFMVDHKVKFPTHKIIRIDLDPDNPPKKLVEAVNRMNGELLRKMFETVSTPTKDTSGHTPRHRERSVSVTSVYAPGTPYMMSPACSRPGSRAGSPMSVRGVSTAPIFNNIVHPDMANEYANANTVRLGGSEMQEKVILEREKFNSALSVLAHPTMPDSWKEKVLMLAFHGNDAVEPRNRRQSDSFGCRNLGDTNEGDDGNRVGGTVFRRQSEGDRDDNFRGRGGFRRGGHGGFGGENADRGGYAGRNNNGRGFGGGDNDVGSGFNRNRDEDRDADRGFRGGRGGFRGGRGRGDFRGRGRGEFRGGRGGGFRGGFGNNNDNSTSFRRGLSPSNGQNETRKRSRSRDGSTSPAKKTTKERSRSYSRSRSTSPVADQERRQSPTAEATKKTNIETSKPRRSYSRSPNRSP